MVGSVLGRPCQGEAALPRPPSQLQEEHLRGVRAPLHGAGGDPGRVGVLLLLRQGAEDAVRWVRDEDKRDHDRGPGRVAGMESIRDGDGC